MGRFLNYLKRRKTERAKVLFSDFADFEKAQREVNKALAERVAALEEKVKERDGLEVRVRELEERCKKLELDLFEEKNSREASVTSSQLLTEYIHGEEGSDYD